jgi:amino acid/amide ABC transporter substrate-binding protein, HAAT family (TC 3.A.1.4.-)
MRLLRPSGVLFLAFVLAVAACAPAATPTAAPATPTGGPPIRIGAPFNLTGGMASIDVPAANGARLAAEEINAAGGVLGRPLELLIRDTKTDPATAATVVTQLIEQDKVVAVIGFNDSDYVLAAGPICQRAGIPFITVGATSPRLPGQVGDMLFLTPFGDNVQAAVGAEFAFEKFGKTAYLLWDKGAEFTTVLAKYFKDRFTELGGSIVLEDTYQSGDKDFSAQIAKVKALPQQPDFYYISALPDDVGTIVKQFRNAGITGPIVGGDGYDTPLLIQVAGPAAENVFFTTHSLLTADSPNERVRKFVTAYKQKYGTEPEAVFAALGYDTVYVLAEAIRRAGSTDGQAIKKALESIRDFPAVTGVINYSPQSHIPQKGVTVIEVKGGKFTLAAERVPQKVPAP